MSKKKNQSKAAQAKTENKAAKEAPENKGGEEKSDAEIAAEKAADLDDDELMEMAGHVAMANTALQNEIAKRGLNQSKDRGLTEADKDAIDHSTAVDMVFLKNGVFTTSTGGRISGRKGEVCALRPDDCEKAIADGLMEKAESDDADEGEKE